MFPELLLLASAALAVSGSAGGIAPLVGSAREHTPYGSSRSARILKLQNEVDTTGDFSYSYETENGIKAEARGFVNNAGVPDKEEQVVTGSYSFVSDNGRVYSVTYLADSNGFRAFGDHILSSKAPSLLVPSSRNEVDDIAGLRVDPRRTLPSPPNLPVNLVLNPTRIPRRAHQHSFRIIS